MYIRKKIMKMNASILVASMLTQSIGGPLLTVGATEIQEQAQEVQKVFADIKGTYDAESNMEIISLEAFSAAQGVNIVSLELPDNSVVHGTSASFQAEFNGVYTFVITYEENVELDNGEGGTTNYVVKNSQRYNYEVFAIQDVSAQSTQSQDVIINEVINEMNAELEEISDVSMDPGEMYLDAMGIEVKTEGFNGEEIEVMTMTGEEYWAYRETQPDYEYYVELAEYQAEVSGVATITATDEVVTYGNYTFNKTTQTITSVNASYAGEYVIPAYIEGVAVLHIAGSTFTSSNVRSVTFESTSVLQTIGYYSFANGWLSGSINMPDTVTSIGSYAFSGSAITSIKLSKSLSSTGEYAYQSCTSLSSVTLQEGLVDIGYQSFYGCTALSNISFPSTLKTIGYRSFYNCDSIYALNFPDGLTSIGVRSFEEMDGIAAVTIPASVISIGDYAFTTARNLKTITIYANISTMGNYTFTSSGATTIIFPTKYENEVANSPWGAGSATVVWAGYATSGDYVMNTATGEIIKYTGTADVTTTVPSKFTGIDGKEYVPTSIGTSVFHSKTTLLEITLPDTIEEIGANAFYGCTKLTKINFPDALVSIGTYAFYNCNQLSSVSFGSKLETIGTYAFQTCTTLSSVIIPDNVKDIGAYAFSGCTGITTVTLGSGITRLDNYTFHNNTTLTRFTASGNFNTIAGQTFNGSSALKEIHLTGVTEDQFVANGGATTTNNWAATNAVVIWADSIYQDGYVFDKTTQTIRKYLGSESVINIPSQIDGVDVKIIGANAFESNTVMEELNVPDTVTEIKTYAFASCSSLKKVYIGSGIEQIGYFAFYNDDQLSRIVIDGMTEPTSSINYYAFYHVGTVPDIYFTSVYETDGLFRLGTSPASWALSASCKLMWANLIYQDNFMFDTTTNTVRTWYGSDVSVEIPEVFIDTMNHDPDLNGKEYVPVKLGDSLFASKTGITSMTIPNSVEEIGTSTFSSCTGLVTIFGGEGIKTIGNYAFYRNYVLLNPPFYDGLESIGSYSFAESTTMQTINIPDSVTYIGNHAFNSCTGVTTVTVGTGVKDCLTYTFGNMSSLTRVTFNGVVNTLASTTFTNSSKLTDIVFMNNETDTVSGKNWGAATTCAVLWGDIIVENGYVFNPTTGSIVQYRGDEITPVIPSEIGGITVTTIGASAFASNTSLMEVTIPSTVTSIESLAFGSCTALTKVTIEGDENSPAISIGSQAFYYTTKLDSICISGPVEQVYSNAFQSSNVITIFQFTEMEDDSVAGYTTRWGSSSTGMTIAWKGTVVQDGYVYNSNTRTIIGYRGTETILDIPSEYTLMDGSTSTALYIGASAFESKTTITSVRIPESIVTIGSRAFYGCTAMITLILPENLESIGTSAFYNCNKLLGLKFGDTLTTIGDYAFQSCTSLISIIFGEGIETIGYYGFYGCTSLVNVELGNNFNSLGGEAFRNCTSLQTVSIHGVLPENGIGVNAFYNTGSLEYVHLVNNTLDTVVLSPWGASTSTAFILWKGYIITDEYVFDGITGTVLKYIGNEMEVEIPSSFEVEGVDVSVKTIGNSAFRANTRMISVTVPETVTVIEPYAFYGCSSLVEAKFSEGLYQIEDYAFYGCSSMTTFNMPESLRIIGAYAFQYCTKLFDIMLPGDILSIGYYAFDSCSALEIIYIPLHTADTLSGANWGNGNSTLTVIWSNLIYQDGFVYNISTETITRYVGNAPVLNVPAYFEKDGVEYPATSIAASVFASKSFITKVSIPETVREIGDNAFYNSSNITEIIFAEGVEEIGANAFRGVGAVRTLVLPESLKYIDSYAFYNYDMVSTLHIPDGVEIIGTYAFAHWDKLETLTMGSGLTTIDGHAFRDNPKLSNLTIGENVKEIGTYAFYACSSLTYLEIPYNVRQIGTYAFQSCSLLKEVVILGEITSIGTNAFNSTAALEMIFLPMVKEGEVGGSPWGAASDVLILWSNIILQDGFLFNYDTKTVIKYIGTETQPTMPYVFSKDGIDYEPEIIGSSAFQSNTTLQKITIAPTIKTVSTQAFWYCTNLKEVTFVGEVETIASNAFGGCSKMEVIYLPQNESGSVDYASWGAASTAEVIWSNYILHEGFIFDIISSEIIKYIGTNSTVVIPSTFTKWITQADGSLEEMTFKATKIADSAFASKTIFMSVTISEGITTIGKNAFQYNTQLQKIVFPETLTTIEEYAFRNCTQLATAEFPESLLTIGNYAFQSCTKLILTEIGNNVISIGTQAFQSCTAITSLVIGDSVKTIGDSAFNSCTAIKTLEIGTGLTSLGGYAFYYNSALTTVTINADISAIPSTVFGGCSKLATIYIPEKLEGSIPNASWGASNAIVIWKDIIYTGDYLFNTTYGRVVKYYGQAADVVIPKTFTKEIDGVEQVYVTQEIGTYAFYNNQYIVSVTVPDSVTTVRSWAFHYSLSLANIVYEGKIETMESNVYHSTSSLKVVYHTQNLEGSITGSPWSANTNNVDFVWSNQIYYNDFIFDMDTQTVVKYIGSSSDIVIPESFTKDGVTYKTLALTEKLFQNKAFITKVTVPASVATIGAYAFSGCTAMTEISLSDGLTEIGAYAFYNCNKLVSVEFPETLEVLGISAFERCTALTSIEIGDNLATISSKAFYYCTSLASITMGDGVKTIGSWAFHNMPALQELTLGDGVTKIEEYAFSSAGNLTKVTIPGDLNFIGTNAFAWCSSLAEIHIPQKDEGTVTGSPWGASSAIVVWKDTILTDDYIYSISREAIVKYRGSSSSVVIPESFTKDGEEYKVTTIEGSAFYNNTNIVKVEVPATVTTLGTYTFAYCYSLTEVIFNGELTSIGNYTFSGSNAIKVVVFEENLQGTVANQNSWGLTGNAVIVWANYIYSNDFVYDISSETVIKYVGSDKEVAIPDTFEKKGEVYIPKRVGASLFAYNTTMTQLYIPEGVTHIEEFAVRNCTALTDVILPDSLTNIERYAFYHATKLANINFPDELKRIDDYAFQYCYGLLAAVLPGDMDRLGEYAFANCTGLLKVELGGAIASVGLYTFQSCTSLTSITFGPGFENIPQQMFNGCSKVSKLVISEGVKTIGLYAFSNMTALREVYLPESIESVNSAAFTWSWNIEKIFVDQYEDESPISGSKGGEPWGCGLHSDYVFYRGELVRFTHTIDKVDGLNERTINIDAELENGRTISKITLPDGTVVTVNDTNWSDTYNVKENGTYTFTSMDSGNTETTYEIVIDDIGIPIITAQNATIELGALDALTEESLIALVQAEAVDEAGTPLEVTISASDLAAVKAMTGHNQNKIITITCTHPDHDQTTTKQVMITTVSGTYISIIDESTGVTQSWHWVYFDNRITIQDFNGEGIEVIDIVLGASTIYLEKAEEVDGYTFSYWNIRQSTDYNIVVTPVYTADTLSITFYDSAGDSLGVQLIKVGTEIVVYNRDGSVESRDTLEPGTTVYTLPEPKEEYGYDFDKWSIGQNGQTTWATPNYIAKSYEVAIEDKDGNPVGDPFAVEHNKNIYVYNSSNGVEVTELVTGAMTYTLSEADEKQGYTFTEWTASKDASGNIAVKPSYTINSYEITIKDAVGAVVGVETIQYGKSIIVVNEAGNTVYTESITGLNNEIKLPSATEKEGYEYKQWVLTRQGDGSVIATPEYFLGSYTMRFELEDGTEIKTMEQNFGETLIKPQAPELEGRTFDSWSPEVPTTVPGKNTTYTAVYTNNLYSLTFKMDGSIIGSTEFVAYGSEITAPTPTKAGYTFAGWLSTGGEQLLGTMPAYDLEYSAQFVAGTGYTITFVDYKGNTVRTAVMDSGDTITIVGAAGETLSKLEVTESTRVSLPDLQMEGNYVKSWNFDEDGGDMLVSPEFDKSSYTVKFVWPDGTLYYELLGQVFGDKLETPEDPTMTGYTFNGWNPSAPSTVAAGDVTYKAIFVANKYTVRFEGEDGAEIKTSTVEYGSKIDIPSDLVPTKEGYTFSGWSPTVAATMPDNNVTYKATYVVGEFDKSIDVYDSTGAYVATVAVNVGDFIDVKNHNGVVYNSIEIKDITGTRIDLDAATFKDGYVFTEWSVQIDSNSKYTFTPNYEKAKYTATFYDYYGNVIGEAQSLEYNDKITVPADSDVPSVEGLNFAGWSPVVPTGMPENNINFVAQFIDKDTSRVTIQSHDSQLIGDIIVAQGTVIKVVDVNGDLVTDYTINSTRDITLSRPSTVVGYEYSTWSLVLNEDGSYTVTPEYSIGKYTVTFMVGNEIYEQITGYYGDRLNTPTNPTSADSSKVFAGWDPLVSSTIPAANTLYEATFQTGTGILVDIKNFEGVLIAQKVFDIGSKLISVDNDGNEVSSRTVYASTEFMTLPEVPELEGYTFQEWEFENGDDGNVTAKMIYTENVHTLKFVDEDGSTISTEQVKYGAEISEPDSNPSKSGYTFAGWDPKVVTTMPDNSVTYTATYIEGTYNIVKVFDADGYLVETLTLKDNSTVTVTDEDGSEITNYTITKDTEIDLPTVTSREGYDIGDWDVSVNDKGNAVIKQVYNIKIITITFMDTDGSIISEEEYEYGEAVVQPNYPSTGGTFAGWSPNLNTTAVEDVLYTANYAEGTNMHTIDFYDYEGNFVGTKAMAVGTTISISDSNETNYTSIKITGAGDITLPEIDFSVLENPEDYELAGWDLIQMSIGGDVMAIASIVEKGNILTFLDADGNVIDEYLRAPGRIITPPEASLIPVVEGKTFSGWSPQLVEIMPDRAMTYTAVYTSGEYKIVTILSPTGVVLGYKLVDEGETVVVYDELGVEIQNVEVKANTTIELDDQAILEGYTATGFDINQSAIGKGVEISPTYDVIEYTVTFKDYDDSDIVASKWVAYGTDLTTVVPESPARSGYTFTGWTPSLPATMPAKNVTYTATYVEGDFNSVVIVDSKGNTLDTLAVGTDKTITVYDKDGDVVAEYVIDDTVGKIVIADPEVVDGLTFLGWEITQDEIGGDATIKPIYQGGPFTVEFQDYDGTVKGSVEAEYGIELEVPTSPEREGYTFTGWVDEDTDKELDTDNATMPSKDTVYTAQYDINQYVITFEDEEGNAIGDEQTLDYDSSFVIPATPEVEGYELDKWIVKDSDPEEVLDMDTPVVGAEDVTYVLIYKVIQYTVTYYAEESPSVVEHEVFTEDFGATMPEPSTLPTSDGQRFIGWSPAPSSTVPSKDTEYWPIFADGTGNVVTVRDYENEIIGYYVIAVGNTVTMIDTPDDVVTNVLASTEEVVLPKPSDKEGYSFTGYDAVQSAADASVVITPQYEINQYKVTFVDKDGNTFDGIDAYNLELDYDEVITAPNHTAHTNVTGYDFKEWVDADTEVAFTEGSTVPASDVTYKATYIARTYNVTFTDENGDAYAEAKYNLSAGYETSVIVPAGPEKEGYTFLGWESGATLLDPSTTSNVKVPLNGITYKAKYEINTYNAVFYTEEKDSVASYTTYEEIELSYDAVMESPLSAPSKADHTFIGWTPALPTTMPAQDLEFWPTYVEGVGESIKVNDHNGAPVDAGYIMVEAGNTITINYDKDGLNPSIVEKEVITVVEGNDDIILLEPATPTGYSYTGWEVVQDVVGGDITLTPQFTVNSYKVVFNNAETSEITEFEENFDTDVTVPAATAVQGYDFTGWVLDDEVVFGGDTVTVVSRDIEYIATYKIRTMTITYFDHEDVEIESLATSKEYQEAFYVAEGPARVGHTFTGWEVNQPADLVSAGTLLEGGTEILTPDSNVKLTAQYDVNKYDVRFEDYNQAIIKDAELDYNTIIVAPEAPSRSGYTFIGWFDKVTNAEFVNGETLVKPYALTYVAKYEKSSYEVVYYGDVNKENVHYSASVEYEGTVPTPNTYPELTGYTFLGWDISIPASMPAEDLEFTPIFVQGTKDVITITDHNGVFIQNVIVNTGNTITAKYSKETEFVYNITDNYPDIQLDMPPEIDGYTYDGWTLEQSTNGSNVVLTPVYKKNIYTIKFINYDGNLYGGDDSVQVLEYGDSVVKPEAPTREGYTFTGWSPVFTTKALKDVTYTATFVEGDFMTIDIIDNDGELVGTFAMSEGDEINVFNMSDENIQSVTITEFSTIVKLVESPELDGYDFKAWDAVQEATGSVSVYPTYTGATKLIEIVDSKGKVLAEVKMDVGNSVYQLNQAGEIIGTMPILAETVQVKATTPSDVEGYTFTDTWTITKDEDGNYTISPIYLVNSYKVVFVDYDNWILQESELEYATEIEAPIDPYREGYIFTGWSPEVNDTVQANNIVHKAQYMSLDDLENDDDDTDDDADDDADDEGGNGDTDGNGDTNGDVDGDSNDDTDGNGTGNNGTTDDPSNGSTNEDIYIPGSTPSAGDTYYNNTENNYVEGNTNTTPSTGSTTYIPGSSTTGTSAVPGTGTLDLTGTYSGGVIPGVGDINVEGSSLSSNSNSGSDPSDRSSGYLNNPADLLHLYHIVFIFSGLMLFGLLFKKRRLDDFYSDELFLRKINQVV